MKCEHSRPEAAAEGESGQVVGAMCVDNRFGHGQTRSLEEKPSEETKARRGGLRDHRVERPRLGLRFPLRSCPDKRHAMPSARECVCEPQDVRADSARTRREWTDAGHKNDVH